MASETLFLYGRAWCHLCSDMRAELEPLQAELGFEVAYYDVDERPDLEARYDELVPVLMAGQGDGELELCHYRLDEAAVRAHFANFR